MPALKHCLPDLASADAAGHMLARAFGDDPFLAYVLPDPAERTARAPAMFAVLLRDAIGDGLALATEPLTAVLTWQLPPADPTPAKSGPRSGPTLGEAMGEAALHRLGSYFDYVTRAHHALLPPTNWYISVVGVEPGVRGLGHGRILVEELLARADAVGRPVCLDSIQPLNFSFWRRLGFRRVVEGTDPGSGMPVVTWQRDGRSTAT